MDPVTTGAVDDRGADVSGCDEIDAAVPGRGEKEEIDEIEDFGGGIPACDEDDDDGEDEPPVTVLAQLVKAKAQTIAMERNFREVIFVKTVPQLPYDTGVLALSLIKDDNGAL